MPNLFKQSKGVWRSIWFMIIIETFLPKGEMDVKHSESKDYGDEICTIRIIVTMRCISLISATMPTMFQFENKRDKHK